MESNGCFKELQFNYRSLAKMYQEISAKGFVCNEFPFENRKTFQFIF